MKALLFLGVLTIATLAFGVGSAYAATFTVDTNANGTDATPGNGICATAGAVCTLHAAIQEANALAGTDNIDFNIPGAGVHTITPAVALPNITSRINFSGETQPGATCGTLVPAIRPASNTPHTLLIEIDASLTNTSVFRTSGASQGTTISGLSIHSVQNNSPAISLTTTNGITVECNYIGTDASGTTAPGNSGMGILTNATVTSTTIQNNLISGNSFTAGASLGSDFIAFQNNLVGTTADGTAAIPNVNGIFYDSPDGVTVTDNVISGNTGYGVYLNEVSNPVVSGNYIGLGVDGSALGNGGHGLLSPNSSSLILGGDTDAEKNVISANQGDGVNIYSDCTSSVSGTTILGNFIGTNSNGDIEAGYGNTESGIQISGFNGTSCTTLYANIIGGDGAGESNVIAGNGEEGITIFQDSTVSVFGVAILVNSIFGNGGLSIDLATDSVADASGIADTDIGLNPINNYSITLPSLYANSYINYPIVNSAVSNGSNITVNYDFQANPVVSSSPEIESGDLVGYRLDFYVNTATNVLGGGEGQTHIGYFIVDGSEDNSEHTFVSSVNVDGSTNVAATATVLWQNLISTPDTCPIPYRSGTTPPYYEPGCVT